MIIFLLLHLSPTTKKVLQLQGALIEQFYFTLFISFRIILLNNVYLFKISPLTIYRQRRIYCNKDAH